jgi:hypothetical protein
MRLFFEAGAAKGETSGRAPTLDQAKHEFLTNWTRGRCGSRADRAVDAGNRNRKASKSF